MKRKRRTWLRRATWLAIGGLLLLGAFYVYLTRPARLRSRVLEAMARLPFEAAEIGRVTFSLRKGLEVRDLVLSLPGSDSAPDRATAIGHRPWLHVARARVGCDLGALIKGRVQAREVALSGVEVRLDRDRAGRVIEALLATRAERSPVADSGELPSALPSITLDRADVRLLTGKPGEPRLVRRALLRGTGMPTGTGYEVRIAPLGGGEASVSELHWDRRNAELRVTLDWVEVQTVALLLPSEEARVCQDLGLSGRARVRRAVFRRPLPRSPGVDVQGTGPAISLQTAEVLLADVRCSIPVEELADGDDAQWETFPPSRRFLQLDGTEVTLEFTRTDEGGGTLTMRGTGRLNGSPAEFTLALRSPTAENPRPTLDDILAAEFRVDHLSLPTLEEHPSFVESPHLPHGVRKFFHEYRPSGPVNLRLQARPTASGSTAISLGSLAVEGEVEALGAACRYYRFPYDFADVRGRLRLGSTGIFLDGLRARHGSARARIDGVVNHARRATGFDLAVHGESVALDADLFAALPEKYQRLWEQTFPLGACDATVRLRRNEGAPDAAEMPPTAVQVDARLLGGSLRIGPGRRLRAADGRLTITEGHVRLHDLHGYLDGAAVRLAGTVGADDSEQPTDVRIEAADVRLERSASLGAGADGSVAEVHFTGHGDVWGHLRSTGLQDDRQAHYAVHIKDGVLTGFDPAAPWRQCQGWINVSGQRQEAIWFGARQADADLSASGALPTAAGAVQPVSLEISVTDAALDRLVGQVVPPRWAPTVAALGLSGPGTVSVQLYPDESAAAPAGQSAELHLTAERMTPTPLPVELRDIRAQATLTADGVELHSAQGRQGQQGQVSVDGRVNWQGEDPAAEFGLSASQVELTPELVDAMPEGFARLLRRLAPTGRMQVELDRVRVTGGDSRTWQFDGRLVLEAAELFLGLPLTALDGQLRGTCTVHPDGETDVSAEFSVREGRLDGRPIDDWEGHLERRRGDHWVRLEDLHGRLCGGDALGFVNIDPDTSDFELSLTIQDVNLGQLLPPKQTDGASPHRGRVEGRFFLRGTASDVASRHGGGNLRIRGGSFLQTPVLATVAEARRQQDAAISDALDLAELRFVWKGSELKFTRVDIQGRDLRLVGDGTWNMETDAIALTLVGAHPDNWPRIALLTDLLEIAGQELLQYHVGGTAAAPQVQVEPLHKLNATLRALLADDN